MWSMKRPRWTVIIAVMSLAALFGAVLLAYRIASYSIDAEITHQAYTHTLRGLTAYVHDTVRWPMSWEDIAVFDLARNGGLFGSQESLDKVRSRVHINFSLSLKDVSTMTPETFSAVSEVVPNYGPDEPGILNLLRTVKELTATLEQGG